MFGRQTSRRGRRASLVWLGAAPALVMMLAFIVIPFLMALALAFTDQRLVPNLNLPTRFVGLRNFRRLYEDDTFRRALINNLQFGFVVVPTQGILGLLLALLVNQKLRFVRLFRAIFFSPVAVTTVVVSMLWGILYDPGPQGAINQLAQWITFGLVGPHSWLRDERLALPAIMLLSIWQGVGLSMTVYLAGLQGIPRSLYEASEIDGANWMQRLIFVTLPELRNTIVFVLVTTALLAFRLFTPIDVLTLGGPRDATTTTIYRVYVEGFRLQRVGYASAMTVVFFLIVLTVSTLQRRVLRERNERV